MPATDLTSGLPLVFAAVGVVCVILGVVTVVRDRSRRRDWLTFPGRVVGSRLDDGQTRSRISYLRDGREIAFWNRYSSTSVTDPVGREVLVLVNPDDPDDAMVGRGLLGGGAFGIGLVVFGVVAVVMGFRLR